MDIFKWVVMLTLLEVDCVEDPNLVGLPDHLSVLIFHWNSLVIPFHRANLQGMPALQKDAGLGIGDHIGAVHLQEVGLQPEPCLTGSGSANDQYVFVSRIGRILWPVAHHQTLGSCDNHVVLKHRILKWSNIIWLSPPGGTVLGIVAVLLCVFPFQVNCDAKNQSSRYSNHKIHWMKTRQRIRERLLQRPVQYKALYLRGGICALRKPPCLSEIRCEKSCQNIWNIQDQLFLYLGIYLHRLCSRPFCRIFGASVLTTSLSFRSCFRRLGFFSASSCFATKESAIC